MLLADTELNLIFDFMCLIDAFDECNDVLFLHRVSGKLWQGDFADLLEFLRIKQLLHLKQHNQLFFDTRESGNVTRTMPSYRFGSCVYRILGNSNDLRYGVDGAADCSFTNVDDDGPSVGISRPRL